MGESAPEEIDGVDVTNVPEGGRPMFLDEVRNSEKAVNDILVAGAALNRANEIRNEYMATADFKTEEEAKAYPAYQNYTREIQDARDMLHRAQREKDNALDSARSFADENPDIKVARREMERAREDIEKKLG